MSIESYLFTGHVSMKHVNDYGLSIPDYWNIQVITQFALNILLIMQMRSLVHLILSLKCFLYANVDNNTQVQQPSLWIYNLENDKFISRFEFPPQILARGNGLASVTVDAMPDQCDNAFAYIPDLVNYRLYVYR